MAKNPLGRGNLDHPCSVRGVLDRIGDQWSFLVIRALANGTLRFNELGREVKGISKQMLSSTLKRLEQDGYVARQLYPEVPPRVEYSLTPMGRSFLLPMNMLIEWADEHHEQIRESRRQTSA